MKKTGFSKIKKPLLFTLLAVLAVTYYIYLSHRNVDNNEKMTDDSPVSVLLSRDMNLNYPADYYEVMKYFADVNQLWYKEDLTQDEITGLAQHVRAMFDDELLALEGNDYDTYLANLGAEIDSYKSEGRYINNYELQKRRTIETKNFKGRNYSYVTVKYYVRIGKQLDIIYQKYTLRKDEDSRWKILYWEISDGADMADD